MRNDQRVLSFFDFRFLSFRFGYSLPHCGVVVRTRLQRAPILYDVIPYYQSISVAWSIIWVHSNPAVEGDPPPPRFPILFPR
jgi:hypothetical protein